MLPLFTCGTWIYTFDASLSGRMEMQMTPTFQLGGESGWYLCEFRSHRVVFTKGDSTVAYDARIVRGQLFEDTWLHPTAPMGLLVYPVKNPHELLVYDNATLLALLSERGLKTKEP